MSFSLIFLLTFTDSEFVCVEQLHANYTHRKLGFRLEEGDFFVKASLKPPPARFPFIATAKWTFKICSFLLFFFFLCGECRLYILSRGKLYSGLLKRIQNAGNFAKPPVKKYSKCLMYIVYFII